MRWGRASGRGRLAPLELRTEAACLPVPLATPSRPSSHSERRSPFALFATRTAATGHIFLVLNWRPSGILPGLSRLLLGPVLRWLEALPPETKRVARRPLEQVTLEGRERDDACRAACGTCQFFLKTDRARARSELGESQRGCRRGLEGGAPWGGSPKQHPPSPVWKTHH